jgi:hypothetical protein
LRERLRPGLDGGVALEPGRPERGVARQREFVQCFQIVGGGKLRRQHHREQPNCARQHFSVIACM